MKPTRNAVAFVVWNKNRDQVLTVQRPSNDKNLPNVWGLPAGSLHDSETFEECVLRSGMEKLGVKLQIVKPVAEGKMEREEYILNMKEFEAIITDGKPIVPQNISNVTQYQNWKWAEPTLLIDAAEKGSLCSKLLLGDLKISY